MALKPPRPRRRRSNPFTRTLSDEAVGLIAGFLLATTTARVAALAVGIEQWTTTWRIVNALSIWAFWPLEVIGLGKEPMLLGYLRPLDVLAAFVLVVVALFLLASRTYERRA